MVHDATVVPENSRLRRHDTGRRVAARLVRKGERLEPLVAPGEDVAANQIIASFVPVSSVFPCAGGATVQSYIDLARSTSLIDRYTAVKALGRFADDSAVQALQERLRDNREHIYVHSRFSDKRRTATKTKRPT